MTAIAAAVCAPFALLDFTTFVMTAGLAVVAYNEFCGRRRLLQFDPEAARLLGFNQIGLLTLIVLYCLWMLYSGLTSANPIAAELAATPGAADLLGPLDEVDVLYRQLVVTLYGTVIVLTAIFQGLNALYYFSRRRHIEAYVADTPEWVRDLQRSSNA